MPRYEMALILKAMEMPAIQTALKRTTEALLQRGAIIRSMENLGERPLPYRMFSHAERHTKGVYFIMNFDSSSRVLPALKEHLYQDSDVVRPRILRKEEEVYRPCQKGPCDFGELDDEKRKRLMTNLREGVKKL